MGCCAHDAAAVERERIGVDVRGKESEAERERSGEVAVAERRA